MGNMSNNVGYRHRGNTETPPVLVSHRIHIWYIYLHFFVDFYGKRRQILPFVPWIRHGHYGRWATGCLQVGWIHEPPRTKHFGHLRTDGRDDLQRPRDKPNATFFLFLRSHLDLPSAVLCSKQVWHRAPRKGSFNTNAPSKTPPPQTHFLPSTMRKHISKQLLNSDLWRVRWDICPPRSEQSNPQGILCWRAPLF